MTIAVELLKRFKQLIYPCIFRFILSLGFTAFTQNRDLEIYTYTTHKYPYFNNMRVNLESFGVHLSNVGSKSSSEIGRFMKGYFPCLPYKYCITILKFQIELKDHKSLWKVMLYPIWCSIQVKTLWTEINLVARSETTRLPTVLKVTVNCVVLSLLISL
jgi:hypothetical protein